MNDLILDPAQRGVSFLGPARVLAVEGRRVLVALPEARAWATMALGYGYEPVAGDVLLVLGGGGAFWVTGVIAGRGRTTLTAHGDLELSAPHGRIELSARDGVTLRGRAVQLAAQTLDVVARRVRQRFGELRCMVRGVLRTRAGRAETDIEGTSRTRADRIVQLAQRDVTVDGEKIHLG